MSNIDEKINKLTSKLNMEDKEQSSLFNKIMGYKELYDTLTDKINLIMDEELRKLDDIEKNKQSHIITVLDNFLKSTYNCLRFEDTIIATNKNNELLWSFDYRDFKFSILSDNIFFDLAKLKYGGTIVISPKKRMEFVETITKNQYFLRHLKTTFSLENIIVGYDFDRRLRKQYFYSIERHSKVIETGGFNKNILLEKYHLVKVVTDLFSKNFIATDNGSVYITEELNSKRSIKISMGIDYVALGVGKYIVEFHVKNLTAFSTDAVVKDYEKPLERNFYSHICKNMNGICPIDMRINSYNLTEGDTLTINLSVDITL